MQWLSQNGLMLAIYLAFIVVLGTHVRNLVRYHDVENWPAASAHYLNSGGESLRKPIETQFGQRMATVDTRWVRYAYVVDGKEYRSRRVSPNGGGSATSAAAYYHPSNPAVAVLNPEPYRGTTWVVLSFFLGFFVCVHAWFAIQNLLPKKRSPARQLSREIRGGGGDAR